MYFPNISHRSDAGPPVPASPDGAPPGPRPPADPAMVDEATTEVPVLNQDEEAPAVDDRAEKSAEAKADETGLDEEGAAEAEAVDEAEEEEAEPDEARPAENDQDYDQDEEDPDEVTAQVAPWADLTVPAAANPPVAVPAPDDSDADTGDEAETDDPEEGTEVLVEAETTAKTTAETIAAAGQAPAARLRPGDVAEEPIAVWSEEAAQRLRADWRDLQVLFIDDPGEAVAGAKELVTTAVRLLSENLLAEQEQFDPHRSGIDPDTEAMRVAMRRYREFLDRVLAL